MVYNYFIKVYNFELDFYQNKGKRFIFLNLHFIIIHCYPRPPLTFTYFNGHVDEMYDFYKILVWFCRKFRVSFSI